MPGPHKGVSMQRHNQQLLAKQPKIKKLSKEQAANKATQTKDKEKPL